VGIYINPLDGTSKEEFLVKHGRMVSAIDVITFDYTKRETELPVVLVDNGAFTAALVAYCEREAWRVVVGVSDRYALYYVVPTHHIVDTPRTGILRSTLDQAFAIPS
jgi:hypothetical protein